MRIALPRLFVLIIMSVFAPMVAIAGQADPGKVVFSTDGFWRGFYTLATPMIRDGSSLTELSNKCETPLPPEKWQQGEFDDSEWMRLCGSTFPFGGNGKIAQEYLGSTYWQYSSPCLSLICVRGRFDVANPAAVGDLTLDVKYRGGVVVYLNGKEVARQDLAAGAGPKDLASDYPPEAFVKNGKIPTDKEPDLMKPRNRQLSGIRIPASALHKGVNVIAIEVHRSAYSAEYLKALKLEKFIEYATWATCALIDAELSAGKTTGVTQNFVRPRGMQIWNSNPMSTDYDMDYAPVGEPLKPIQIVTTRGGSASGKVVVGSDTAIKGLSAKIGDLSGPGGATIPATAVQIRWALPGRTEEGAVQRYGKLKDVFAFEALAEVAPTEVPLAAKIDNKITDPRSGAVQPIWVTVNVPAGTAAGDYTGTLNVTAGTWKSAVPVSVKVCNWQIPDTQKWRTFVELIQSPETIAMQYKSDLWSDKHFEQITKSLALTGQVGAKTLYIPLINQTNLGNTESMVRWKKSGAAYDFDLSIMKRYLDIAEKNQGKPLVVVFYVWDVYLEHAGDVTLRYAKEGAYAKPEIFDALDKLKGKGPRVSMLNADGKVEELQLPLYTAPEGSDVYWKKLFDEIKAEMKKRGLEGTMALGIPNDAVPAKEVGTFFAKVAPGVPWARHAHGEDKSLTYSLAEMVWAPRVNVYPDVQSKMGWKRPDLFVQFPRGVNEGFPMTTYRLMAESVVMGGNRGIGRIGADFWTVLTDKKGQKVGTLSNRWPFVDWRNLAIKTSLLAPGPDGAISTHRFEMLREGVEECEARIFIEQAMDSGKVTGELAGRCKKALESRAGAIELGMQNHISCGFAKEIYHTWWNRPSQVGYQWYVASDWQKRSAELFALAAEVAKATGAK